MASFKLAAHTIFQDRKEGRVVKQFLLDSGIIVMYENFWDQITLISLFHNELCPINQKIQFNKIKSLMVQTKSLVNLNKRANYIKLTLLDIMAGFAGTTIKQEKVEVRKG